MIDWRLVDGDSGLQQPFSFESGPAFHSGVVFAGRFFMVGTYADLDFNEISGIWSSQNGRTWELANIPDLRTVSDLVAGAGGLLAVGDPTEFNTPLWLTTNGTDWTRVVDTDLEGERIANVGATGDGFVAVGTTVLTSPDGLEWTLTSPVGTSRSGMMARRGDMLLRIIGGAGSGTPLEAWSSADLVNWTKLGTLPRSRNASHIVLAAGPLGWIVAGYDDNDVVLRTFMWVSVDGATWAEVGPAPGPVSDLFVDQAGFVAVGFISTARGCAISEGEIQGFTWTSLDGQTWARMPLDGFVGARVDQLFRDGRTLLGVGARYDEEDLDTAIGSVWTARLPQLVPAGPAPTAAPTPTREPGGCGH